MIIHGSLHFRRTQKLLQCLCLKPSIKQKLAALPIIQFQLRANNVHDLPFFKIQKYKYVCFTKANSSYPKIYLDNIDYLALK